MPLSIVWKTFAIWLCIAFLAILNGIVRERLLVPTIGKAAALPMSGVILCIVILLVTYFLFPWFGRISSKTCWLIGLIWLLTTLAFEFLFGHFVIGKTWAQLVQTLNIFSGDLFLLALVVSLLAPRIIYSIKN